MTKKGRPKQNKQAIKLSLNKSLIEQLKASKVNISTLAENLLVQHLSLYSNHNSPNSGSLITPRSL